jgi:hypothetical protein
MPAALDQCDAREDIKQPGPGAHGWVRPGQPVGVGRGEEDLRAERMAPLHNRAVEVRVAGGDRAQPAALPDPFDGLLVEEPGRVPQQVAFGSLDEQRPLADRHGRVGADAEQARLHLTDVAAVPGAGQFGRRRPPLPYRRYPLALVGADDALPRRRFLVGIVIAASGADPDWHVHPPAQRLLARPRRSLHRISAPGAVRACSDGPESERDRQAQAGLPMGPRTRSGCLDWKLTIIPQMI